MIKNSIVTITHFQNDKIANTQIRQMLAKMSLSIIPESLAKEPIVIAIDDTTIAKFGKNLQMSSTCMIIQFTIQKIAWSMVIVL